MDVASVSASSAFPAAQAQSAPKSARVSDSGLRFSDILSALNPLQYLPVIGTIYRAVTNDTIPETLRLGGSFLVSALTGGPIGMVISAATAIATKVTGIDPERIAHDVFADLGLTTYDSAPHASASTQKALPPAIAAPPWTAVQRAAYAQPEMPAGARPAPPVVVADRQAALDSYRRSLVASVW